MRSAALIGSAVLVASIVTIACGKEGPPLPPLVRLPAPPADVVAARRGESVDIRVVVPSANTDGSRPANIERVEVYAITAPATVTDDQLLKLGTRVGAVGVNAARDPDEPVVPNEDVEVPAKPGIDQGAAASLAERLEDAARSPVDLEKDASRAIDEGRAVPLAGSPPVPPSRLYAGVGVNPRGRRGPFSARAAVPLAPPPPAVPALEISYDETAIAVSWKGLRPPVPVQETASDDVLPATLIGWSFPTTGYNLYEVTSASSARPPNDVAPGRPERVEGPEPQNVPSLSRDGSSRTDTDTKLTSTPIAETRYEDKRLEWGVERCYRVRVAQSYENLMIESEASPVGCITPADTFPPRAPTSVQVVPSDGAISLTWQRGDEKDFAGFIVLRGSPSSETQTPVTAAPIQESSFIDKVSPGVHYVYAVQAVDKAGNRSAPSARSEPTAAR